MKTCRIAVALLVSSLLPLAARAQEPQRAAPPAAAPAAIGAPAPDFTLTDTDGKQVTLASLKGGFVVLEWFNPDCPFVRHARGEGGALRGMDAAWAAKGVTWLAINSNAEGKQGHGLERNRQARADFGMSARVLLDPAGTVGRAYGAKTTPHVYVIDKEGTLVYRGGVDNAPMGEVQDGSERRAYLLAALQEATAGKPVTTTEARPYGCSVKYAGAK